MAKTDLSTPKLDGLSEACLQEMAAAGREINECYRALKKADSNIVAEIIRHNDTFYEWDHYPPGDVVDWETHSQHYYHAHPKAERTGEHGHFHTFLRYDGIPADLEAVIPKVSQTESDDRIGTHLVAISMDKHGFPVRMFTVNRWVTDETWYAAAAIIEMLDYYLVDHTYPSWATNRWITAMLKLFKPQILALVAARDKRVAAHEALHAGKKKYDVYEDRELELTSSVNISVPSQIKAVARALKAGKSKK